MSSTDGTSKSKKGLRGLFRDAFGRSSSHLPVPSTSSLRLASRASFSSETPNEAYAASYSPGARDVPQLTGKQLAASESVSAPGTISAAPINPPPSAPQTAPAATDPIDTTPTVTNVVWAGMRTSLQALRDASSGFSHLSEAARILLECFDGVETAARNQNEYDDLAGELTTLTESLAGLMKAPIAMTKSISSVEIAIKEQAKEIKGRMTRGSAGRLFAADEEDVMRRYQRIQLLLQQLQLNLSMSGWSIANKHLVNSQLDGLNPVKQATYDSTLSSAVNRRKCTQGTRTKVLSDLDTWLNDGKAPTVYWMNGMAGTGKTTIACTFSAQLESKEKLAASFFCTRTTADCRDVTRIVPTIAYQLARYSIPFQSALHEILDKEPDAGSKNAEKQFERLLRDPLRKAKDAMPDDLVVVIDALDECEDRDGVQGMLDMLFRYAPDIPLKFLVTSRPEREIYGPMDVHAQSRAAVHLHDIEASFVRADIALYLEEVLGSMSLEPTVVSQLVDQSGSLFIYAATLVRYIQSGPDPKARLYSVLSMTPEATRKHAQIDALYTAVLKSALNEQELEKAEVEDIRAVLRTVLFAQEPISVETVATLSGVNNTRRVQSALLPLKSVLHQSEQTGLVSTLHASFPDFMFSNERSGEYFCDIVEHGHVLAERCFTAMKDQLRFNICELESSFVPDDKVDDLQDRIKRKISPTLAYASRYWGSHLALASKSGTLMKMLEEFICYRLLFWMEVLSLRREMVAGTEALLKAKQSVNQAGSTSSELAILVEDARNFVTSFAAGPASQSTPHIYISSLPFCPRLSSVYKNYRHRTRGLLELKGSLMERRESAALATWNIGSIIWSVAYSPDGTRVAVGCHDGTVRILNAHDGTPLVDPFQGHTREVYSVVFSPDGKLVASGSVDCNIRVQNAYNGTLAAPFGGHTQPVESVSFSPDGKRIVSGSGDKTIRIWNVSDGTLFKGPLEGHTDSICSVAFSPNGALIASTSYYNTVRLWKSHDGTLTSSPFEGHTNRVVSVAFTPDGSRLVSGSWDKTICVWNISDGSLVSSPFKGHTGSVLSVAVSPDGTRVASGSGDCTVRVWRIEDGTLIAGPFVSHTSEVYSVAYSPDGTRVISGSRDKTIQVWKVHDGLLPPPGPTPFQGHMSNLKSVSLSSNGVRILSGSKDDSIWVWDISPEGITPSSLKGRSARSATHPPLSSASSFIAVSTEDNSIEVLDTNNGSLVAGPLPGHTDSLTSSVFSADNMQLITGSRDHTIRIWDLQKAGLIGGPFHGHGGMVTSLALSLDCMRLISCSKVDKTIRVWNMQITPLCPTPPTNSLMKSPPDNGSTSVLDGWNIHHDGWLKNNNLHLLFWIPSDFASKHVGPFPHVEFIITEHGMLHIPQQELLFGEHWARCYISE